MEQRLSMITLGVADLKRAVAFYEKVIGWKATSSPSEIAFLISAGSYSPFTRTMTWQKTGMPRLMKSAGPPTGGSLSPITPGVKRKSI